MAGGSRGFDSLAARALFVPPHRRKYHSGLQDAPQYAPCRVRHPCPHILFTVFMGYLFAAMPLSDALSSGIVTEEEYDRLVMGSTVLGAVIIPTLVVVLV